MLLLIETQQSCCHDILDFHLPMPHITAKHLAETNYERGHRANVNAGENSQSVTAWVTGQQRDWGGLAELDKTIPRAKMKEGCVSSGEPLDSTSLSFSKIAFQIGI